MIEGDDSVTSGAGREASEAGGRALARVRASVIASWHAYAAGAPGAGVRKVGGATAAIFPAGPAREVFNNALLDRGLGRGAADAGLAALEEAYAAAEVERFAAWAQEDDAEALAALEARGYRYAEATRPMLAPLDAAARPTDGGGVERVADAAESLALNGVGADLLDPPPAGGRWYVVREGGRVVSTALALVFDGDCQISFVATHPEAQRRGHAGRVLARLLADAIADGCATASLHSTEVAERLYAAHGFAPLPRFVEWAPPTG